MKVEFLHRKEFNGSVIKEQYKVCEDLYLITHDGIKYKLILLNEDNQHGKKIGESRDISALHDRIPDYYY
jgi:hypothetical protein